MPCTIEAIYMKALLSTLLIFCCSLLAAQISVPERGKVFRDDLIPRIDISISAAHLANLMDPNNTEEFPADFIYQSGNDKDTIYEVGFRLRGNTSLFAAKKSFKISFNTFVQGQKFAGLEKMNINGEHNDPSVIRSKICWDLLRELKLPGSRSNHVDLYINGDYYGIYLNTEHIDEEFVELYFGNKTGNLYKCLWPADMNYIGADPDLYKFEQNGRRAYDLKTNTAADDYSDLAHFIDILNNTPDDELACALEEVFNIDHFFQYIAFDILTGNWDGPLFNKNNFYLYHNPETGLFEYIAYDLDNTLGIDFFSEDWGTRPIYTWGPNENRPLYDRFMEVPELRDRFSFFMERIIERHYNPDQWFDRIDAFRNMIEASAEADPYRPQDYGFTYNDFLDSYEEALSGFFHVSYGLKPFIEERSSNALDQLEAYDVSPVIWELKNNQPLSDQELFVGARVEDNSSVTSVQLCYQFDQGAIDCVDMWDDGLHNDLWAGDGFYGVVLPPTSADGTFNYYIEASDDSGQISTKPFCGTRTIEIGSSSQAGLYINELMASNDQTIADEWDEYDDWLELYNHSDNAIYLGDKYLSDDPLVPNKWALPDMDIEPGEFLLFWIDDDEEDQGPMHANFKLAKEGETIGIYDSPSNNFGIIDQFSYPALNTDQAYGRLPNGIGVLQIVGPTPGDSNVPVSTVEIDLNGKQLSAYPNPMKDILNLEWNGSKDIDLIWSIQNSLGQKIISGSLANNTTIPTGQLSSGLYFLSVRSENGQLLKTLKLIK